MSIFEAFREDHLMTAWEAWKIAEQDDQCFGITIWDGSEKKIYHFDDDIRENDPWMQKVGIPSPLMGCVYFEVRRDLDAE